MSNNNIKVFLSTLRQKGNLAYEYHPFHNYQTNVNLYKYDDFIIPETYAIYKKNGELLTKKNSLWIDRRGKVITDDQNIITWNKGSLYAKSGSLIDFNTQQLNFDLDHPVDIQILPSYDGSVNLILNDDKNPPRLINSRFSVKEKNTYEIVDRIGENDTNIYSSDTFDKDTSLYYHYKINPKIDFEGYINGILPVGQYCFYFTYCDADENESDYIAESGLIPLFIGTDCDPMSMDGGIKNLNSNKGVKLQLTNLDNSYSYLKIYYIRYFADYGLNRVYECKKIYKKYPLNSSIFLMQINGFEETEDLDPNILNISQFNPKHLLAQAQCKNMLFFGNIVKNSDNYKELSDVALRIIPSVEKNETYIKIVDNNYKDFEGNYGYYNSENIYNKVGYANQEYYRFGVVFIYNNGTLSNVYNVLGRELNDEVVTCKKNLFTTILQNSLLSRNYIEIDNNGWIGDVANNYNGGSNLNGYGVCRINKSNENINTIYGIKFKIPLDVQEYLKNDLNIRGCFFVRQKRIPVNIAQCVLLPIDEVLEAPVIEYKDSGNTIKATECFLTNRFLQIENGYTERLHKYTLEKSDPDYSISKKAYAAICPDFLLDLPYYNQIFNSSKFKIQKVLDGYFDLDKGVNRYYNFTKNDNDYFSYNNVKHKVTICSVTENVPSVSIEDKVYKLEMGTAEESFRFKWVEVDNGTYTSGNENIETGENLDREAINAASNMSRGIYSPYLAVYSESELDTSCIYNIYLENDLNLKLEFQNRMDSHEPFYAISDRYNFENLKNDELTCWRGDCFINMYTHRLNRNFNDPTLPNNDQIIDPNTWKKNYDAFDSSKWTKILRSDLNAVQMGSWITFPVKSAMNYALRSQDHSYVSEEALMGSPRSYYPRTHMMWKGVNKMPDSYLYNDAYRATLGFKCYFTLNDINYVKDTFSNRILYSAISILDSFKNNYRYSLSTYFRDYSQEYGSITKLVGFEGYLLVVFEHAIGIAVINERVLAGGGDGEPVFINTSNVLPEELTIITDTYGTLWSDSVIKSEAGYVYGVDTIAKKIWRVKGQQIEILSDFTVGKFLNDNITLGEREVYPTVGLRNVKTHYNNNKKDIMFTFYDDIYEDEEKVWNLCYNELLGLFITFYSWVPGFSENIDTQFFSFDRQTVKKLALLGKHNYNIPENQGVLVDSPCLKSNNGYRFDLYYTSKNPEISVPVTIKNSDGTTTMLYSIFGVKPTSDPPEESDPTEEVTSTEPPDYYTDPTDDTKLLYKLNDCEFRIERDHWENDKYITSSDNKTFKINIDNYYTVDDDGEYYALKNNSGSYYRNESDGIITYTKSGVGDTYIIKRINSNAPLQERLKLVDGVKEWFKNKGGIVLLKVTPYIDDIKDIINISSGTTCFTSFKTETIALTLKDLIEEYDEELRNYITSDFYLHGQGGIFNVAENLYPCWWYGKQHPFEFEFVVNDKIGQLKIFTNLEIISNKAEPESFHFEIEGDNYEFSSDKRTMYFRQEATKNLFLNLGSNMLYDRKFTDVISSKYNNDENYYRLDTYDNRQNAYPKYQGGLVRQVKSSIFPLYYEKTDTYDEIYHDYTQMAKNVDNYDFKNLSGSEIKWYRDLNQFNVITHIKNSPIDLVGRLRGNSRYKEGKWSILIPSIIFNLKNESSSDWVSVNSYGDNLKDYGSPTNYLNTNIPPIVINTDKLPALSTDSITFQDLPNIYKNNSYTGLQGIQLNGWTARKETKIRDKWMKVRIRYSGKNLAVIHSIITLYNISYS